MGQLHYPIGSFKVGQGWHFDVALCCTDQDSNRIADTSADIGADIGAEFRPVDDTDFCSIASSDACAESNPLPNPHLGALSGANCDTNSATFDKVANGCSTRSTFAHPFRGPLTGSFA